MPITSSSYDLELQRGDGSWLPLMLAAPRGNDGLPIDGAPKTISEMLEASDDDLPTSKRLAVEAQESWIRGVGLDYNAAPGVYTRTDGYAIPAGLSTDVTIPATNNTNTDIRAMAVWNGDLFVAQRGTASANTSRIMRSVGQTGALTDSRLLEAGDNVWDLLPYVNPNVQASYLYASSNLASQGRILRFDGATWTVTAAGLFTGSHSRRALGKVFWVGQDGIGGPRMLSMDGDVAIAYTVPSGDPQVLSAWVQAVPISEGAGIIITSKYHAWFCGPAGVMDLNGLGDSPNLVPYFEQNQSFNNGQCGVYMDGSLYVSFGSGMVRIPVDSDRPMVQEAPGYCGPGFGTAAESEWLAYTAVTAMCVDQGYVVAATWDSVRQRAAVWWGRPRESAGIESGNPLIWYGPEVVGSEAKPIKRMLISTPSGSETARLWIASGADGQAPSLSWVSLPVAGAPISGLISGTSHRFAVGGGTARWNHVSQLELPPAAFGERASKKALHQHTVITRGLGSGTQITLESRADAAPASTTWTQSDTVTSSPKTDVTPSSVLSGWLIGRRLSFVAGSTSTPGVLDAVRSTAWKTVPSFGIRQFGVEYGSGVLNLDGGEDTERDPDTVSADLVAITNLDRTVLRDRNDKRWTVRVFQILDRNTYHHESGPFGKTVEARLEIGVIAGPL